MKNSKHTSIIKIIEDNAEAINDGTAHDHIMFLIESDENGLPNGKIVKVKGHPFNLLGMLDVLSEELKNVRNDVMTKFKEVERKSQSFNNVASDADRDRLRELEAAARTAAQNGDLESLDNIKDQLMELLKNMKIRNNNADDDDSDDNSSDSGEFRIDDFKGGF